MSDFQADVILGATAAPFQGNGGTISTRIYAGPTAGTFDANDSLQGGSSATVTGRDCVIITDQIGSHNDVNQLFTLDLARCVIDLHNSEGTNAQNAVGGSSPVSLHWTDVTLHFQDTSYSWHGNFGTTGTLPTYRFNNVNFWGNTNDAATDAQNFYSIFTSSADFASSEFNNVSFYNDQILGSGETLGGYWQTTSTANNLNTVLGPTGNNAANPGNNRRAMIRFAGTSEPTGDHAGLVSNLDFRAVAQAQSSAPWGINIDGGGRVRFINWLPARNSGSGPTNFVSQFGGGTGTFVGRAEVFVGTNPVTTDGGDHTFTFTTANITDAGDATQFGPSSGQGILILPDTAWDPAVVQALTTETVHENITNGFAFRQQNYARTAANGNYATVDSLAIADLTSPSYRKYSYRQQTDNDTWGREIFVSVPPFAATDEQITTARNGGYDLYNGLTWDTETVVDDPLDPYVALLSVGNTAFADPGPAETLLNVVGGVNTGSRFPVTVKANRYAAITNTHEDLPYSFAVAEVTFDRSITLDGDAATLTFAADLITFPVGTGGLTADQAVQEVSTTGDLTLVDGALGAASTLAFSAAGNLDLNSTSPVGTLSGATITNLPTIIADGSIFTGTYTETVADQELTVVNSDDVAGLTLATSGAGSLIVFRAAAADFAGVSGDVTFAGTVTVVPLLAADDGLLSVFVNDVLQAEGVLSFANPAIGTNIDVVYTQPGRTDFVERLTVDAATGNQNIVVVNGLSAYPGFGADNSNLDGIFTILTPVAGVVDIAVAIENTSEGQINAALQEQVKGTANYNLLLQQVRVPELIGSDGINSTAFATGANITFVSISPFTIGYVRETSTDQALLTRTLEGAFTPTGGEPTTIDVGVTILPPSAFDPAITQSQLDAVAADLLEDNVDQAERITNVARLITGG